MSYDYLSFVYPLTKATGIGASIQYFNPGKITGLDASANAIGDVDGYYANYTLALGQAFGTEFGLGLSGHMVKAKIDDVSASAVAADGGLLWRPTAQWR